MESYYDEPEYGTPEVTQRLAKTSVPPPLIDEMVSLLGAGRQPNMTSATDALVELLSKTRTIARELRLDRTACNIDADYTGKKVEPLRGLEKLQDVLNC